MWASSVKDAGDAKRFIKRNAMEWKRREGRVPLLKHPCLCGNRVYVRGVKDAEDTQR